METTSFSIVKYRVFGFTWNLTNSSKSRGGSRLQFGPELVEYIEVKKAKKTHFDDQSTIYQASVRDDDSKLKSD